MVTAPRCKVCGEPHWGSEPHRFGRAGEVGTRGSAKAVGAGSTPAPVSTSVEVVAQLMPHIAAAAKPIAQAGRVLEGLGPKRDRAAYMRAYRLKKGKAK